jgi:meso-butanediol dehydrogenase / (S,S)-butanediol dehydrogenase / diacetyl reductase
MKRFDGKVAFVTGGASGIGDAIVRQLLSEGARVAVLDMNEKLLDDRRKEFDKAFYGISGDVTEEISVSRAISSAAERFGGLHVAFNAAGGAKAATPIIDQSIDNWNFTMDLCLKGVLWSVKHEARQMLPSGRGAIVNIASINAHIPVHGVVAYCCAKAGVEMLSKVAALELSDLGVRVNTVLPGYTRTPLTRPSEDNPEFGSMLAKSIPMRRAAEPGEIAAACLFLASDDASYLSGSSIVVDGGWKLSGIPDFRRFSKDCQ